MTQYSYSFLSLCHWNTHKYGLPTLRGGLSSWLVSMDNMASLAPRNSTPDERSSKKVLKLDTPSNFSGSRTVGRRGEERAVRSLHVQKTTTGLTSITRFNTNSTKMHSESWKKLKLTGSCSDEIQKWNQVDLFSASFRHVTARTHVWRNTIYQTLDSQREV